MRFQPSRRLILFCAVGLILVVAPLAFFVFWAVREVVTPPVTGTRFLSYEGLSTDGACANSLSARGGQALMCFVSFHFDSRFAIVDHNSGAVAWCVQRVDDSYFNPEPIKTYGPLTVGTYPVVPSDWSNCTALVPKRAGMYLQIILRH
jgi:hypothetical protein